MTSLVGGVRLAALAALAVALTAPVEAAGGGRQAGDPPDSGVTITGTVTTAEGDLRLEGAAITIEDAPTGAVVGTSVSDGEGRFEVIGMSPGSLRITVFLSGFEPMTRTVVTTAGEPPVVVDFDLSLAGLEEDVRVEGQPGPPLDILDTPMLVESLEGELFDILPIRGENFDALLPLLPGVVRDRDGRLSVKGGLATQTSLRVNSVNVSDPVTGEFGTTLPDDAVDTIRLLPNPYAAEYGGFSAGVSEIETRRGGDEWTWAVTNFVPSPRFRGSSLQGIDKARPRLTFSGPLKEGRVHLAQSMQYRVVKTKVPVRPETSNDNRLQSFDWFTQLDADLSPNHLLQATFSVFPRDIDLVDVNTFNPREISPSLRQRGWNVAVSERTVLSPNAFLETTFAFKKLDMEIFGQGASSMLLRPEENRGSFFNDQEREAQTFQFRESLSWQRQNWMGDHVFKLGVEILDARFAGESLSRPVEIRRADDTLSQRITYGAETVQNVQNTDIGLFIQDRWRASDRLLLELGTRLDRNGVVKTINVAPRAGIVYSVRDDGGGVFRGGVGLFLPETTLNVEAFEQYETPTVTWFAADGVTPVRVVDYRHRLDAKETPSSLIWNAEYFHEFTERLYGKVNFLRRAGDHELILHPLDLGDEGVLELRSDGRSRYWEVELTTRMLVGPHDLNFSYVRSRAEGDLNVYDDFFGNFRTPIVRPNQFSLLDTDTRNRFLFRGVLQFDPWIVTPVLEVRQGFPFSAVNEDLFFVGPRNQAGRFPTAKVLDFAIQRPFTIAGYRTILGFRAYHLFGTDLPMDVQQNLASPSFGTFSNQVERSIGFLFRVEM